MELLQYVLHTLAFLAQIAGGVLVVREAHQTLRNIRSLKAGLDGAEGQKDIHRNALQSQTPQSVPGLGGGRINLPRINPAAIEGLVQQVGPGAAAERKALRDFLEGQFSGDGRATWLGVGLLFLGIVIGYVANLVGVAA
ncbi:MAG: hypothetical protein DI630_18665 [Gordonia sp. (in: high G+C Gram-positive bacteria)]|nr:MAG: hypothetical protein DI630_18665 [Gordonia sp. (in: high G+C Gram-positive bacteria)]